MKLVFEHDDIEKILIEHAVKQGIKCNAIDFNCSYSVMNSATAFWSKDVAAIGEVKEVPISFRSDVMPSADKLGECTGR